MEGCLDFLPGQSKLARRDISLTREGCVFVCCVDSRAAFRRCRSAISHARRV